MPELPEVEAVCRKLRRDVAGARIVSARLLRKRSPALERAVRGRAIAAVERLGKNILLVLDSGSAVRVHLRMTGNLYVIPDLRLRPEATRAWFALDGGRALILDDSRALGVVDLLAPDDLRRLRDDAGIEPLSEAFTLEAFAALAGRSRAPAKLFLMDQTRVAGLGNIYAAEVLHRARVHPRRPMNRVSRRKIDAVRAAIVGVLNDAVQSACNAYSGPGRFEASETFPLGVYGREGEPCPACGRLVKRIVQAGRSTYYCPGCQR
ncbi:MAG: hypothetical protein KIT09_26270 [Bryobacteraceae bacterium]|nr:hypothetical protein [Bryobacteraceae bacterium]